MMLLSFLFDSPVVPAGRFACQLQLESSRGGYSKKKHHNYRYRFYPPGIRIIIIPARMVSCERSTERMVCEEIGSRVDDGAMATFSR